MRYLWLVCCLACCVCALAWPAHAQQSDIVMDVQTDNIGLGGIVQRGVWTPARMDLTNRGADSIEVHCRWLLQDVDGDELIAQREKITIGPTSDQSVWLYAVAPMSTRPDVTWVFQVVDAKSGKLIQQTQKQLPSSAMAESSVNLIGICGSKELGLYEWHSRWTTQHEPLRVISRLNLQTMPDRWYGLDSLSALIWTPEGGRPTKGTLPEDTQQALREWVYRGGHLVIVMPFAGEEWTGGDSGLSDLLAPIDANAIKQVQAKPPFSVFGSLNQSEPVGQVWFDLDAANQKATEQAKAYTTLAEVEFTQGTGEDAKTLTRPLIVGHRFGFGQVTLVGIDLSNAQVLKLVNAFSLHRVWTRIFSWRASKSGDLLPNSEFDNRQTASQYQEAKNANHIELGTWLSDRLARQGETGPAVGLAFVLFCIYAAVAGLTFPHFLRGKGWERHSWLLFVGIVAVFSAIAWGGAWIMRPADNSAAHFTVLDIDAKTQTVHARSWQSLLIPSFTEATIALPTSTDGLSRMDVVNVISSPGHALTTESPGYPDQRTYRFEATRPNSIDIPMRSTTKSIIIDYLGKINTSRPGMKEPWRMPDAKLSIGNNALPAGTITHHFPDKLSDVTIIYCPGGAQQPGKPGRPMVYEYRNAVGAREWEPGKPLALPASSSSYEPLWIRPNLNAKRRVWNNEGYLGKLFNQRGFMPGGTNESTTVYDITLLSFYDALPPPVYETQDFDPINMGLVSPYNTYNRSLMRGLDITQLITGQRIILIGHLKNARSPVPLTVDGQEIESKGWTIVRWIYDF